MDGNKVVRAVLALVPRLIANEGGAVGQERDGPVARIAGGFDDGETNLDAHLLEGEEVVDPETGGVFGLQVGTAVAPVNVGLVEAEYVGDVDAVLDQGGDVGEEGGVVDVAGSLGYLGLDQGSGWMGAGGRTQYMGTKSKSCWETEAKMSVTFH